MTTPEEEERKRALEALLGGAPYDPGPLGGLDTSLAPAPVPEVDTAAFEAFAGRDPVLADPWSAEELQAQADAAQRRGGATALPTDMPLTGAADLPEDLRPPPGTTLEVPETDGGGPMVRQAVKRSPAYNALAGGPPVDPGPLDALDTELEPVEGTTADVAEDAAEGVPEGSPADAAEDAAEDPEMAEIRALAPNASAPDAAPPEAAENATETDPWLQMAQEFMQQAREGGGQNAGLDVPPPPLIGGGETEEKPAWPIIAAMFLDVAANKGRGLPQLGATALAGRGGGAPGGDAAYENYKRQRQYALDKAGGRRGIVTPLDAARFAMEAKREGRLEKQRQDLEGYRDETVGLRQRAEERNTNPQSDYAKAAREVLIANGADPEEVAKLSSDQMKQNFPAFKADIEYAQRGLTAAVAGEKAGAVAEAQHPFKMAEAREGALARTQAEREAYSAPIPGTTIVDPKAYEMAMGDPALRHKVYASVESFRSVDDGINDMVALRQKYGVQLPGAAQAEFDANKTVVVGAITQIGSTGVLNEGEWKRYSSMLPGVLPSWQDLQSAIANGIDPTSLINGDALKDVKLDQLRGVQKAMKARTGGKLRVYGIELQNTEDNTPRIRVRVNGRVMNFRGTPEEAAAEGYEVL